MENKQYQEHKILIFCFFLPPKMYKKLTETEMEALYNELYQKYSTRCSKCNEHVSLYSETDKKVYCRNKVCPLKGKKISMWKNTIFHKSKLSPIIVLRLVEKWINMLRSKHIAWELSISRVSVWKTLKRLTDILVPLYYSSQEPDGCDGEIWEIDESKFGKRKYNRGHPVDGVWVLGMAQRGGEKKVRLIQVERRDKITLTTEVISNLNRGVTIYSDRWKGYVDLQANGYVHETVNHSEGFVNPETGVHTNLIEGTWSGIKQNVPFKARSSKYINPYLVRYMLVKNHHGNPFLTLINMIFYLFLFFSLFCALLFVLFLTLSYVFRG